MPIVTRSAAGAIALRQLLRGVMLRRTKASVASQLELLPCTFEDMTVTLTTAEKAFYILLEKCYNRHHEQVTNTVCWS